MYSFFHTRIRRRILSLNSALLIFMSMIFCAQPIHAEDFLIAHLDLSVTAEFNQVTLSWTMPVDTVATRITTYEYSKDGGITWVGIPKSDQTTTSYIVTGLVAKESYNFKVQGIGAFNRILARSNVITVVPGKISGSVNGLILTRDGYLGTSLALSSDGDALFVGASGDHVNYNKNSGAVYVFAKNEDTWMPDTKIAQGTDGLVLAADDSFGYSIASSSSGNTLFVGAPGDDAGESGSDKGAVHVFARHGDTWIHDAKITNNNTNNLVLADYGYFGNAIVLSPDESTLYVGAFGDNAGGSHKGAVYIFTKSGNDWTYAAKITDDTHSFSLEDNDHFGSSLALSSNEDTLFIGALGDNAGGSGPNKGAVYILTKNEDDWVYDTKIADSTHNLTLDKNNLFGFSIALSPDERTLYVGALGDTTDGSWKGGVYTFTKNDGAWAYNTKIVHDTEGPVLTDYDFFGASLVISPDGTTLLVGAPGDDTNGIDKGAVHSFAKSGDVWIHNTRITHGFRGDIRWVIGDHFGSAVAISPDKNTLFIGADRDDVNDNSYPDEFEEGAGAVHIFTRGENSWEYEIRIGDSTHGIDLGIGDSFGDSLALSPDGNTLFVGTPGDDTGGPDDSNRGAVHIFTKDADTWTYTATIAHGTTNGLTLTNSDYFGRSLVISPDGETLYVGAHRDNGGGIRRGAVYVFTKNNESVWTNTVKIAHGPTNNLTLEDYDYFGWSLAISPDGNTLFVGAYRDNGDGAIRGAVHVFTKNNESVWTSAAKISDNTHGLVLTDRDFFGISVAVSPNGNTLFVGASRDDSDLLEDDLNRGAVHVFTKSNDVWTYHTKMAYGTNGITFLPEHEHLGDSLAISSDGETLYVGAASTDASVLGGAVHVFTKGSDVWTYSTKMAHGINDLTLTKSGHFGSAIAISPDGNTLFVGAYDDDGTESDKGAVRIFKKKEGIWVYNSVIDDDTYDTIFLSGHDFFGVSLALSPDGNTLFIGASGDSTSSGVGAVYIFTKDEADVWEYSKKITSATHGFSLDRHNGFFGSALAVSSDGKTLIVGVAGGKGAVYIFTKNENIWRYSTKIDENTDGLALTTGDYFGSSIALSPDGSTLFIGASGDSSDLPPRGIQNGAVYRFTKDEANVWVYAEKIQYSADGFYYHDYFGSSIALSPDGNTLFIGALNDDAFTPDNIALRDAGVVYLFKKRGGAWEYYSRITHDINGPVLAEDDNFGQSIAISLDGNVLYVGAVGDDTGGTNYGAVYSFVGGGDTWVYGTESTQNAP